MVELSRHVFELLRSDKDFILYRARCGDNECSRVLVASPAVEYPAPETLKLLEHAYSLREELDARWAARPIAMARHWDRTVLVMEDPGGVPLDRLLGLSLERATTSGNERERREQGAVSGLELTFCLRVCISLASAIDQLHQRGIIHKDIKPAHVLVNSDTGQCWLRGFGIASRLPRERQAPESPEFIAGTLAYMAPEQTGRMNRSIDSRSDLYSLGVTLYQMFTGSLPFTAMDPMEWVHCHIARLPEVPAQRVGNIPKAVSAIIMKLLAKTAEERYQTAAGVENDLRRCLMEWERGSDFATPFTEAAPGSKATSDRSAGLSAEALAKEEASPARLSSPKSYQIEEFPLGEDDTPDRLLIPEKLYGRAHEIDILLASFDRIVASGRPELVLVSGYSGIGKSSVVHELHKVLAPPRGLFASGKFDQYKRNIPYSTLVQAFQSLVRPLLGKSDAELAIWRGAFLEALEPNARLMTDLLPELKLIIGDQTPVPELEPQQAQRRFQLVFRRFIGVFARPEHPLALFLDDLQWLDAATLDLLQDLVTSDFADQRSSQPAETKLRRTGPSDLRHLMLIGAYRDNEVNSAHPLMRKLEVIRQAGAIVQEIVLTPLACEDLGRLIADSLRCEPERVAPLARLIHEKTAGNPFFAIQFVSALAEEALLTFDHGSGRWFWDLSRIQAKGYTDNVVDLMIGKLNRLSVETQKALQEFACLGNSAEITTLSIVHGNSEEKVHSDLWQAVRLEFIVRLEGSYKFVHDRVQEAAYSLIPEELRAESHLRIGRLLIERMSPAEIDDNVFDLVNQLNRGVTLISDPAEKRRVAELNFRAGKKAKTSTAYDAACAYLSVGAALLDCEDWESSYEFVFGLCLLRAECEFLRGRFEEAEGLISCLIERAASKADKAAAYRLRTGLHHMKSTYEEAVGSALECLRLFGVEMPEHPSWEQVQCEYDKVWRNLGGRSIESLIDLPPMTDPEIQAATRLLSGFHELAYFTDKNLFLLSVCITVNLSLKYGIIDASAHGYSSFGNILCRTFHCYTDAYRFGKLGFDLVEKHGFAPYKAKVYITLAWVAIWTKPITAALDFVRAAFSAAVETGDFIFGCYCCDHTLTNLLARGDHLDEVWRVSEQCLDFVRKARSPDYVDRIATQRQFMQNMRGWTNTFSTFSDLHFDEAAFEAQLPVDRPNACWYWILKLQARFISGDYETAIAAAQMAKLLLWGVTGCIQLLDYYYYTSLALAAVIKTTPPDRQSEWRETLTAHMDQLREWAESCAPTFLDKHALVGAEIARIDSRDLDAMNLYEQAIRFARENGFIHNEGIANEVAGKFYLDRGFETIAHAYFRNARYCYLRWGATGKVRQLDELYPYLREEEPRPGPTNTMGAPVEHLDLATVIKVSQAVSGEIVLEKLLDTLMRTAIAQAGAERGLLILPRGVEQLIAAEATTSGDSIIVRLQEASVAEAVVPESIVHYVVRTQESVILDDASAQNPFSPDSYIRQHRARSILCLPLINQGKFIGLLYLENSLTPHVFTPARIAVLKLLASQAAMSLENTRLYRDLEEREAKIRRLVDANIMGIGVWNLEGEIIEANEAFLRMVKYSREDVVSGRMRWRDLTPPEWRESDERAVSEAKATGTVQPYEKEFFRKDGSRVPVLLGGAMFEGSGNEGVAFVLDLSEQKRAEEALRRSEAYLAEAQRLSQTGSFGSDVSSGKMYWSQETFRIFEYDPATEPTLELVLHRTHPEDRALVRQLLDRVSQERKDFDFEHRLLMPNESVKYIRVVGRPSTKDESGDFEFVGAVTDVTERKLAEQALQQKEVSLHQTQAELAHVGRVTTMGELAASIAHEVNQPLMGVVTNASASLRYLGWNTPNLVEAKEAIRAIIRDGNRAADVVSRMRALFKKASPAKEPLNINEAIEEVVLLTQGEARRNKVTLRVELATNLPPVMADRVQIQQVVMNLILNGIQAMSAVEDRERVLVVRTQRGEADQVRVAVQDSGIGIDPGSIERMFEAFHTTKPGGMGMGLSISRSIVESHGGRLWATPNDGPGVTFQFTL